MNIILDKQIKNNTLFHAYVFQGSKNECNLLIQEILKLLKISQADFILINSEKSIKIELVRDILRRISLKPHSSKFKLVYLENAGNITNEAANALLKTLEEPPDHSIIVLQVESEDSLIPTIISRCQLIKILGKSISRLTLASKQKIGEISMMSIKEKFNFAQKIVDGGNLDEELKTWLEYFREQLLLDRKYSFLVKEIIKAQINLKTNVNLRLLVENLLLKL